MHTFFGIDQLLAQADRLTQLQRRRVALVAHPASITSSNEHSLDALIRAGSHIVKAFGPQHGMRGDKQDNMIESPDHVDPLHQIPVVSLYGAHRRPTPAMLDDVDVVLFDLQDIGCRIYTYITTLKYFIEACTEQGKSLWVLDRPNPAGRPVDGLILEKGNESFVGCDELPVRHGLTVGELARWLVHKNSLDVDLTVIQMPDWPPDEPPGFGWPIYRRPWINPSPNASSLNMARCFPGTVLLEGTTLSEGRGTTVPLEIMGAPGFDPELALQEVTRMSADLVNTVYLRKCYFEPVFHKHKNQLCYGIQIHTDYDGYAHEQFKPWRLLACLLKAIRMQDPEYPLWRHHKYEYETDRLPIDVINGGSFLREWVDDHNATFDALLDRLARDEQHWYEQRQPWLLY